MSTDPAPETTWEPNPEEYTFHWVLFGNDFNAHYIIDFIDSEFDMIILKAACGARQRIHRVELIESPLFRCRDCIQAQNVPTEARPERP